jgi:peptidoglycan/xylan/chitin deacetylase (PgdA/CDA1 family)
MNTFLSKYKTTPLAAVSLLIFSLSFASHAFQVETSETKKQSPLEPVESKVTTTQDSVASQGGMMQTPSGEHSFVILQYHHVSNDTPRSTTVSPEELEQHMAYLAEYHEVISLQAALDGIKNKTPLPERAVVITFDDGYKNILDNGHPILRKYGFEYTIFINPSQIDTLTSQLSWDDVKKMSKEGVTFANHTLDHLHLLDRYPNEDQASWLARIKTNITTAEEALSEQLGYSKKWMAYPFGEFDLNVKALLKDMGYVGFGQHSGAVGQFSDMQSLPRFPAAGRYANLDTLLTKINSLAMPVIEVRPERYAMGIEEVLGKIEFDVLLDDISVNRIACYFASESLPIKKTDTGFSIDIKKPFYSGRTRVNCTAPSIKESDRFYWYSIPFFTQKEDGTYLD